MFLGTCLTIGAASLLPGRAEACSTDAPTPGLEIAELYDPSKPLSTAPGGLVVLSGTVFVWELAEAEAAVTVTLARDGVAIETEIEAVPLAGETYAGVALWRVVLLARPAEPLMPGMYEATVVLDGEYGVEQATVPVEVAEAPLAPLVAPEAALTGTETTFAYKDPVCCESEGLDSCGGRSQCEYTTVELRPAVAVVPQRGAPAQAANTVVWVAPVLANGELDSAARQSELARFNVEWTVTFAEAQAEYCVVVGATNLVDGTSVQGPPQCVSAEEAGVPHEVHSEPEEGAFEFCVTPPVYDDGTPYGETAPAESEGGCRVDEASGAWGWLALVVGLGLRRRRR